MITTRKQEITFRLHGEPDFYTMVREIDVLVAVEATLMLATVTGRVTRPEQIEIVCLVEFDQDEEGNRVGEEHTVYELKEIY